MPVQVGLGHRGSAGRAWPGRLLGLPFGAAVLFLAIRGQAEEPPALPSLPNAGPGSNGLARDATEPPAVQIAPPAAAPPGPLCEPGFAARLFREARKKVVVVERPEGGIGAGFLFYSRRHVLTAFHVVETGRYARVTLEDGSSMPAEVVAVDPGNDVALLELEGDQAEEPLLPRQRVEVGWPLIAIGHPYGTLARDSFSGVLRFSATQGIVSAVNHSHLQTDALVAPGNSGGPMLTCDGRVIAVTSQVLADRIGFGVPILAGVNLQKHARRSSFFGSPHGDDGSFGFVTHQAASVTPTSTGLSDANYYGIYLGGSVVYRQFAFLSHLGVALAAKPASVSSLTQFTRVRGFLELALGYRVAFLQYTRFPMAMTLGLGPTFMLDRGSEKEPILENAPGCPGAPGCTPRLAARDVDHKGGGVFLSPQIRIRFPQIVLPLEVSYAWQIDFRDVATSPHRLMFGIPF